MPERALAEEVLLLLSAFVEEPDFVLAAELPPPVVE